MDDFLQVLAASGFGFQAFPCDVLVQGPDTEATVCAALRYFTKRQAHLRLDVVCIVRGGGSATDLASWNSYALACAVARMPVPVISGIGHGADRVVIDEVAYQRVQTPTAAAQWLVDQVRSTEAQLRELRNEFQRATCARIDSHQTTLAADGVALADLARVLLRDCQNALGSARTQLRERGTGAASREETQAQETHAAFLRACPLGLDSRRQYLAEVVMNWRIAARAVLQTETRHLKELRRELALLAHLTLNESTRRIGELREAVRDVARQRVDTESRISRQSRDGLNHSALQSLGMAGKHLAQQKSALEDRDPTALLRRGYSLTVDAAGRAITAAARVKPGDKLTSYLANGAIRSVATETLSTVTKVQSNGRIDQATPEFLQEGDGRAEGHP